MVYIKRIYDEPSTDDGYRLLVDRLWPRGLSKEKAAIDGWLKEVAPSSELRKWFGHQPERFNEFSTRYMSELAHNPATKQLEAIVADQPKVTLLYSAKNTQMNQAVVLQKFLKTK